MDAAADDPSHCGLGLVFFFDVGSAGYSGDEVVEAPLKDGSIGTGHGLSLFACAILVVCRLARVWFCGLVAFRVCGV